MTCADIAPRLRDQGWTSIMPLPMGKGTPHPWRWMVWNEDNTPRQPEREDLDYWLTCAAYGWID